ncbi:MAG: hypothetical protein AB1400_10955 [Pseudomonadota bacterium]
MNGNCAKFLMSGVISVILVLVAFKSGANFLGMFLVGVAIASFGLGAGNVMNSQAPDHDSK